MTVEVINLIFSGVIILIGIWVNWGVWFRDWGGKSYDIGLIHFINKPIHRIVIKFLVASTLIFMIWLEINFFAWYGLFGM